MEDHEILDLYFDRDESAITETRFKYGLRLYKVCINILRVNEDAEEVVSDTLFKAWENIPPTRPDMLGAFLAKIARNLSINKWQARGAARRGGGEIDVLLSELGDCIPDNNTTEAEYESAQVQEAINAGLNKLDKTARAAFVLRYFHGESIRGICQRFEMSESKVKSILFRARKKLGAYLEKEGVVI
ncbi:MAG: RNA polymerase sigma factor [Defluviitaleaceae bacterium]|nr:RNA polymerase sigma factor [Defluviitaleaceae bacterium]